MPDDLKKHTLFLREGDWEFLDSMFPKTPTSKIVRKIIANFVDRERAKTEVQVEIEDE